MVLTSEIECWFVQVIGQRQRAKPGSCDGVLYDQMTSLAVATRRVCATSPRTAAAHFFTLAIFVTKLDNLLPQLGSKGFLVDFNET